MSNLDSFGQYRPAYPRHPDPPPVGLGFAFWFNGQGAPPNTLGGIGDGYLDDITGNVYAKTAAGWQLATGGGGTAGGQVMIYRGDDPTSDALIPTDPSKPAEAYKFDGSDATYTWNPDLAAWNP